MKQILVLTGLAILIPLLLLSGSYLYFRDFLESEKPEVAIINPPSAVGLEPVKFQLSLSDKKAGLDEVRVNAVQGNFTKQIFKKKYPAPSYGISETKEDLATFELVGKDSELKQGDATIQVELIDKTFWGNKSEASYPVYVDYTKPRFEMISTQHNGYEGGALTAVYRLLSDDIVANGVSVDSVEFSGFKLKDLSPATTDEAIYFSIFPIPIGFKGVFKSFVSDRGGNHAEIQFYQKVLRKKFSSSKMSMGSEFYRKKAILLVPNYIEDLKAFKSEFGESAVSGYQTSIEPPTDASSDEEIKAGFKVVNEDYRSLLDRRIVALSKKSESKKLWDGVFIKPLPSAPTASFGEARDYYFESDVFTRSLHLGVDLAQSANASVKASNSGKILFADSFGIYGNTIIIDHGFSLMTLYGHLSSISIEVGQTVLKGEVIGKTGDTGLAGGDHLHFEFRLHGKAVNPIEWLDPLWIKSHVESVLGVLEPEPSKENQTLN